MYVENVITLIQEATSKLFDSEFPYEYLRNIWVGTEYPMDSVNYPGVWVNFVPQGDVRNVGIGHVEHLVDDAGVHEVFRWNFSGVIEITPAALGSLERARMVDQLVRAIAFGHTDGDTPISDFRKAIEQNDLVGLAVIWEAFTIGGYAETPGTPWGTDDVIYEATVSLTVEGEFAFAPNAGVLVPLSAIVIEDPALYPDLPTAPADSGWV